MLSLFQKRKILVVEDSKPLLKAIKIKLERGDYRIVPARSFEEAVEVLQKTKKIDAIWLDHYLVGEKTGLDVLKYIRSQSQYDALFIFVVSAFDQEIQKLYQGLQVTKMYIKAEYQLNDIIDEIQSEIKKNLKG